MEPKVWLLNRCHIDYRNTINGWMNHLGLSAQDCDNFIQINGNISPEEFLIMVAAKRCYKSFTVRLNDNVTKVRDDPKAFFYNILKSGHGSVLEHVSVSFAFEGISRICCMELNRHRAGTAISQESGRYVPVPKTGDGCFIPDVIAKYGQQAVNIFVGQYIKGLENAEHLKQQIPDYDSLPFNEKKKLTSAFRRVAPCGLPTGGVWTFNFRALRHVLEMRTAVACEEEIRWLFNLVGEICLETWPLVFQDFSKIKDAESQLCGFQPEFRKV